MSDPYRRAAEAYSQGPHTVLDQRTLEANALLRAASRLEHVRDAWRPERYDDLGDALLNNRKLWTIFATEAADGGERLPVDLRTNVANIAIFVFKRSIELLAAPAPEKIDALIEINRTIASGLMSRGDATTAAATTATRTAAG